MEKAHSDDLETARRACRGEPSAVAEIGARLQILPRLIAVANGRLSSPLPSHEVADVAQDAFLMIWQKLETYEGRGTLQAWAWNFGVNLLRNRVRGVARVRYHAGAALHDVHAAPEDPIESMPYDPEELEAALTELPAEMAEVMRLKHEEGLMFKEIGARLRIADGTAKTRYYRGVARMREILAQSRRGADDSASPRGNR